MHERGQRLDEWLQDTTSKINMRAYNLCSLRVCLKAVLHGPRIKQHAGSLHAKVLLVGLPKFNAAGAQDVQVACSICLVVTGDTAEPAAEEHLCRNSEVAEDRL